jgi:hypothetical protein
MSTSQHICPIFTKFRVSLQFHRSPQYNFYRNPSSDSRADPCGRRTGMTKLRDAFHIYAQRALKLVINTDMGLNDSRIKAESLCM